MFLTSHSTTVSRPPLLQSCRPRPLEHSSFALQPSEAAMEPQSQTWCPLPFIILELASRRHNTKRLLGTNMSSLSQRTAFFFERLSHWVDDGRCFV